MTDPLIEVPLINIGRDQRTNSEATKLMVNTKDKLDNTEKEVETIDEDGFQKIRKRKTSSQLKEMEKRRKENTPEKVVERLTRILNKVRNEQDEESKDNQSEISLDSKDEDENDDREKIVI